MSNWTHPVCDVCWVGLFGGTPVRLKVPSKERCCYCGNGTTSGIYVRDDPTNPPCHEAHP